MGILISTMRFGLQALGYIANAAAGAGVQKNHQPSKQLSSTQTNALNVNSPLPQQTDLSLGAKVAGDEQRVNVQSIPVGQPIDAPDEELSPLSLATEADTARQQQVAANSDELMQAVEKPRRSEANSSAAASKSAEEAAIKIQALVRGHLTRKALKGPINQNALGQRHFDEASLTQNPPSAIFSLSSPFNIGPQTDSVAQPSLNTIAEAPDDAEKATSASPSRLESFDIEELLSAETDDQNQNNHSHLTSLSGGLESQKADDELPGSPSSNEARASIDLGSRCETPASGSASASIDIRDYSSFVNVSAVGDTQMASVLHNPDQHATTVTPSAPATAPVVCNGTSPEAAAIRIQSAFRGYRTRKNSPYRTRSPNRGRATAATTTTTSANGNNNTNSANLTNVVAAGDSQTTGLVRLNQHPQEEEQKDEELSARLVDGFERSNGAAGLDNAAFDNEFPDSGSAALVASSEQATDGLCEASAPPSEIVDDGLPQATTDIGAVIAGSAASDSTQIGQRPALQQADTVDDVPSETLDTGAALTSELANDDLEKLDPFGAGFTAATTEPKQVDKEEEEEEGHRSASQIQAQLESDDEGDEAEASSGSDEPTLAKGTKESGAKGASNSANNSNTSTSANTSNNNNKKKKNNRNKRRGKK